MSAIGNFFSKMFGKSKKKKEEFEFPKKMEPLSDESGLDQPVSSLRPPSIILEDEPKHNHKTTVKLERIYYETGTHGILSFPDGETVDILERPWLGNKRGESCIPEGDYSLGKRQSPLITRLHKGREGYTEGWEVQNVDGRSHIMIHVGNYVKNSDGCLLTGGSKGFQGKYPVVWKSRPAYNRFLELMDRHAIDRISIREEDNKPYEIRSL